MKEKEPKNAEAVIKDIRRRTKRKFSSEEKIRIVISGLRGDESINTICRKEGIAPAVVLSMEQRLLGGRQTEIKWSVIQLLLINFRVVFIYFTTECFSPFIDLI